MTAITTGNKEEVVVSGRKQDRGQGGATGVTDWSGGQSGMKIGVIGRWRFKVFQTKALFVFRKDKGNGGAGLER